MDLAWATRSTATLVGVAALLCGSGCGGSSDIEDQPLPTRGAITVEVTNTTGGDVFIDVTFGVPYAIEDGPTAVQGRHDCTGLCSDGCSCTQCGPPQQVVRRIADGDSLELTWDGFSYERVACGDSPGCYCDEASAAAEGTYTFRLAGRRAMTPPNAPPLLSDPNLFEGQLDQTSAACSAELNIELTQSPQQVSATFDCP